MILELCNEAYGVMKCITMEQYCSASGSCEMPKVGGLWLNRGGLHWDSVFLLFLLCPDSTAGQVPLSLMDLDGITTIWIVCWFLVAESDSMWRKSATIDVGW